MAGVRPDLPRTKSIAPQLLLPVPGHAALLHEETMNAHRVTLEPRVATCAGCGVSFDDAAWATLALAERIEARDVRRLLLEWPDDLCVEVRRCPRCGRLMASKRRAIASPM